MDIEILKDKLNDETFKAVNEALKDTEGRLADISKKRVNIFALVVSPKGGIIISAAGIVHKPCLGFEYAFTSTDF